MSSDTYIQLGKDLYSRFLYRFDVLRLMSEAAPRFCFPIDRGLESVARKQNAIGTPQTTAMTQRIDAHHHLWRYSAAEYGWIDDRMQTLQRNFLVEDLRREITTAGVAGTIAVQARQSLEETDWLLSLAAEHSILRGVVGWAPLTDADFPGHLEELAVHPKLKGLRHVLQGEAQDDFMLREDFNRGILALAGSGLVYDILIYERHLPFAIQFVDRHPNQVFVLDHLAKPSIKERRMSPWREQLKELAARPHIHCKLSGMVTEADWSHWTIDDLRPYFETALECFGPSRLLAGSDWPVCTLASSYSWWWKTLAELVSKLSVSEQDSILGGNAIRVYKLSESAS
jgi:L-fuconolactonase